MSSVFATRTAYARFWFVAWLAVAALTGALAYFNPNGPGDYGGWDTRHAAAFWGAVALLPIAWLMHTFDPALAGLGFRDVYQRDPRLGMNLDDAVVSGMLTVQSIRAAMTTGLLAALLNFGRQDLADDKFPYPIPWREVVHSPQAMFFAVVAAALATSLVTTMAALLCYDYSLRFNWIGKGNVKRALRSKAHKLGVVGFYGLMWSLAAGTALVDPLLCVIATASVFLVMWYYYFFDVEAVRSPVVQSVVVATGSTDATVTATIDTKEGSTTVRFEWGDAKKYRYSTDPEAIGGDRPITIVQKIGALTPGTEYRVRVVAGGTEGEDIPFKTA